MVVRRDDRRTAETGNRWTRQIGKRLIRRRPTGHTGQSRHCQNKQHALIHTIRLHNDSPWFSWPAALPACQTTLVRLERAAQPRRLMLHIESAVRGGQNFRRPRNNCGSAILPYNT